MPIAGLAAEDDSEADDTVAIVTTELSRVERARRRVPKTKGAGYTERLQVMCGRNVDRPSSSTA